ncbi:protein rolling stone-like isoform X2 [Haliotis rufescens]|uniref:protein rolling stone-like isoform X2 n=1 Tax=Haliotis rufescens TaxID=6454 RepID=UPI00201F3AF6|nr:protein rolling stone-like isoform X2 [Haliotis rufescens]
MRSQEMAARKQEPGDIRRDRKMSDETSPLIRRRHPPNDKSSAIGTHRSNGRSRQSDSSDSWTTCSMEHWREQFRCSSFGLQHSRPYLFTKFEWGWPKMYLCWRGVVAAYHVAMIIVTWFCDRHTWTRTEEDSIKWFIYFTNWMFFLLTFSTLIDFVAVGYCHLVRKDIISAGGAISMVNCITHVGNTTYVIINLCIAASPVRFFHFFQPLIVAATYYIFSAVYQAAGGTNGLGASAIYPGLDWSADPGGAALFSFYSCLLVPFLQFLIFVIAMLKGSLFDICLGRRSSEDVDVGGGMGWLSKGCLDHHRFYRCGWHKEHC